MNGKKSNAKKKATKKKATKKKATKKKATKAKSSVDYRAASLLEFPRYARTRVMGSMLHDGAVLARGLHEHLGAELGVQVQATKGFVTREDDRWRLRFFVYVAGEDAIPVEVGEIGPDLVEWLEDGAKIAAADARIGKSHGIKPPPAGSHEIETFDAHGRLMHTSLHNLRLLDRDPLRLIREYAPPEEVPFQRMPSGYTPVSDLDLSRRLERFLALRSCKAPAADPVEVESGLQAISKALKKPLPADYRALYRRLDGAPGLFFGHDLLSLAAARTQLAHWQEIATSWSTEELRSGYESFDSVVKARYSSKRWLPMIDLGGGNFVALDFDPGSCGRSGQLIVFGADVHRLRRIALDVGDLLQLCLQREQNPAVLSDVFEALAL